MLSISKNQSWFSTPNNIPITEYVSHLMKTNQPSFIKTIKFKGIVTNYSISDQIDVSSSTSSSTIALTCNSMVEVLMNKVNGRRTNSSDFTDKSMSKVQALSYSNFNFGAK